MVHPSTAISLLFCTVMCSFVRSQCDIDGHYWKDFTGKIPPDALPGGRDVNGDPIYIGQIFDLKYLIPAKIYSNERRAFYEYGGSEHEASTRIKILCTQHPEQFEWVKTNNDDIKLITHNQLLIGGVEPGTTSYIGRVQYGNEILVGKIVADTFWFFNGLHVTSGGKGIRHTSFEILTYNPKAKKPLISVTTNASPEFCPSKLYRIEIYN